MESMSFVYTHWSAAFDWSSQGALQIDPVGADPNCLFGACLSRVGRTPAVRFHELQAAGTEIHIVGPSGLTPSVVAVVMSESHLPLDPLLARHGFAALAGYWCHAWFVLESSSMSWCRGPLPAQRYAKPLCPHCSCRAGLFRHLALFLQILPLVCSLWACFLRGFLACLWSLACGLLCCAPPAEEAGKTSCRCHQGLCEAENSQIGLYATTLPLLCCEG